MEKHSTSSDVNHCETQNLHNDLDELKLRISREVLARFGLHEIRERSISNIERWQPDGALSPAYAEWLDILVDSEDAKLISAMVDRCERSNQLRQSLPYVGMLDHDTVMRIRAEVGYGNGVKTACD